VLEEERPAGRAVLKVRRFLPVLQYREESAESSKEVVGAPSPDEGHLHEIFIIKRVRWWKGRKPSTTDTEALYALVI